MTYTKHNLYTTNYPVSEHGVCNPPDDCEWSVLDHVGEHDDGGQFTEVDGRADSICLVLRAQASWPVMSFITATEARVLAHMLLEAAEQE